MNKTLVAVLGVVVAALPSWVAASPVATFQGLGRLGFEFTSANGISSDGSTVVGLAFDETGSQAFRWTRSGGLQGLGNINNEVTRSWAFGASADGSKIVGRAERPGISQAFYWTAGSGMVGVDESSPSEFNAVSGDGSIAVGFMTGGPWRLAAKWSKAGGWTPISGIDGSNSFGISGDGSVIVGLNHGRAFRWTQSSGLTQFDFLDPADIHNIARDISADGKTIVGDSGPGEQAHAFRWMSEGGLRPLSNLEQDTFAYGVSGHGERIVGQLGEQRAFVWDSERGVRDLQTVLSDDFGVNLTGWTLQRAFDISADGRTIVGDGTDPSGRTQAWVATLPASGGTAIPLPTPLWTGAVLLAGAFVFAKRS